MGVPDFVKFIARSSPGALCRVPKGGSGQPPLVFDFILIDATNAAQTLGLDTLRAFLHPSHLIARTAIIFALDSQRDRSGTARAHRHALVRIGDLDVNVQKLSTQLTDAYRAHQRSTSSNGGGADPFVLTSGRGVAGEADYKLLDLQRTLVTAAVAGGATVLPTFLFISEDSDVLCGALCGPAPQQVSIATKLQDVLFEPSVLRLDRVLAFVATCTDAFFAENEREAAAAAMAKMKAVAERNAAKALQAAAQASSPAAAPHKPASGAHEEEEDEVELSVQDTAVAAPPAEDVVRRRKQDGPMVATGVRIELTDSSSDEDGDDGDGTGNTEAPANVGTAVAAAAEAKASEEAHSSHSAAEEGSGTPTEGELLVSTITQTSCVDMVFLFMIVMGNAVNVPSLVRGATKVDAGSCWQAYCKQKYKNLAPTEADTGRALLTPAVQTHATTKGSLVLHCHFLHAILEAVHYADAEPRPPVEEEKTRAIAYLSNAVYATLRYVVGCNLERTPELQQTFLDSRPLSETAVMLPSLSAVMWVLGQEATRTFTFPLHGLAKRELLAAASGGATAAGRDSASAASAAAANSRAASAAASSAGDLDVGDHLVAPAASNAWAVRGARTNTVTLSTLLQTFAAHSAAADGAAAASALRSGAGASAVRSAQVPSMTALLKKCLQTAAPATLAKANELAYLMTVWTYTVGLGVRRMAALTKAAASVAKAEGGEAVFTAVQPASAGKSGKASLGAGAANGHYVYSFELRRMAPVLEATSVAKAAAAPPAATSTAPSGSGETSAAQRAVLAALGVSYDYSSAPSAPANVVHLPRTAMDEEDVAEMQRLKKVAKKERALAASVQAAAPPPPKKTDGGDAAPRSSAKGTAKKEATKGKNRLGKRERLKLQKASEKAGKNAAAESAVPQESKKAAATVKASP